MTDVVYQCSRVHKGSVECPLTPKKQMVKRSKQRWNRAPPIQEQEDGKEQEVTDVVYQCSRVHKGSVGCCLTPKKNG